MNVLDTISHYKIFKDKILGKGATGQVYLGQNINNAKKVAIKIIQMKKIDNQVTQYLLNNEKKALSLLKNNNIINALDIIQQSQYCYIITQYCNSGTLQQLIKSRGTLTESEAIKYFKQIINGYKLCSRNQIIHRDLKPSNILIDDGVCKISDFGYCQIASVPKPKVFYNVGSPSYMAPEAYVKNLYSVKSDIWALGVILYEMLMGRTFDEGLKIMEAIFKIKREGIKYAQSVSQFSRQIINSCLELDPAKRISLEDLINKLKSQNNNHKNNNVPVTVLNNSINTIHNNISINKNLNLQIHNQAIMSHLHGHHVQYQHQQKNQHIQQRKIHPQIIQRQQSQVQGLGQPQLQYQPHQLHMHLQQTQLHLEEKNTLHQTKLQQKNQIKLHITKNKNQFNQKNKFVQPFHQFERKFSLNQKMIYQINRSADLNPPLQHQKIIQSHHPIPINNPHNNRLIHHNQLQTYYSRNSYNPTSKLIMQLNRPQIQKRVIIPSKNEQNLLVRSLIFDNEDLSHTNKVHTTLLMKKKEKKTPQSHLHQVPFLSNSVMHTPNSRSTTINIMDNSSKVNNNQKRIVFPESNLMSKQLNQLNSIQNHVIIGNQKIKFSKNDNKIYQLY